MSKYTFVTLTLPTGENVAKVIQTENGISWREAKKLLRKWYLDQAAQLRSLNKVDYFKQ